MAGSSTFQRPRESNVGEVVPKRRQVKPGQRQAPPALRTATGGKVMLIPKISGSEDFSEFQNRVPGFFYSLGALPAGKTPATAAPNHSPAFDFNEGAMPVGVRTLSALALDFLARR